MNRLILRSLTIVMVLGSQVSYSLILMGVNPSQLDCNSQIPTASCAGFDDVQENGCPIGYSNDNSIDLCIAEDSASDYPFVQSLSCPDGFQAMGNRCVRPDALKASDNPAEDDSPL